MRRPMLIVAHRGLRHVFPDNSLEGIVAAVSHSDMIEIDVRASADGHLVLSHDPHLAGVLVSTASWDDLAGLEFGDGIHPTTLPQAIERVDEHPLNIELKHLPGQAGFEASAVWPMEAARMARPTDIVTCFNWPTIDRVRSELGVETGLLVSRLTRFGDALAAAVAGNHRWIMAEWPLVRNNPAGAVAEMTAQGLKLAVWTVNSPRAARRLREAGAAALITDDPIGIRQKLEVSGDHP